MSTPLFQSKKFVSRLAATIGILAIIIFVAANLLSIHAYNMYPTVTQTPTSTATITKTPRPTLTPTITETPTITPTFLPEFVQIPELLGVLVEGGYRCTANQPAEDSLNLVCFKEYNETIIRLELDLSAGTPLRQQMIFEPDLTPLPEGAMADLVWLAQIPIRYPWLLTVQQAFMVPETTSLATGTPPSVTPEVTPSVTAAITAAATPEAAPELTISPSPEPEALLLDQIANWVTGGQAQLSGDVTIRQTFDGLDYSMSIVDGNLFISITQIIR